MWTIWCVDFSRKTDYNKPHEGRDTHEKNIECNLRQSVCNWFCNFVPGIVAVFGAMAAQLQIYLCQSDYSRDSDYRRAGDCQ